MENFNDLTNFYVVGISYRNADLYTRGEFSLSKVQRLKILNKARSQNIKEIFISSTCNRTEIYSFAENSSILVGLLCENSKGNFETFENLGYILKNTEAINQLV